MHIKTGDRIDQRLIVALAGTESQDVIAVTALHAGREVKIVSLEGHILAAIGRYTEVLLIAAGVFMDEHIAIDGLQ